jgi:activating signal cointegrator 1
MIMKTLTLTQPWATLVAIGAKRIETRSWSTSYRGPIAIHAAKSFPKWARDFTMEPICYETVRYHGVHKPADQRPGELMAAYPLGYVLATARLVNILPTAVVHNVHNVFGVSLEPLSDKELAFGDYTPGRFAWFLEGVEELETPILARGALGLWEWSGASECTMTGLGRKTT